MNTLVTGVGPGIGANIALGFAQAGADVVLVARNVERLERLAAEIRAAAPNRKIRTIPGDVGSREETERISEAALQACGRIDVLVNNAFDAAVAASSELEDQTDELWQRAYDVNVMAPLRLTQAFVPEMLNAGSGAIINVLSGSGFQPIIGEGRAAYGTTKAALWTLTRYLAVDLAPRIRVNGLVPGVISPDGGIHNETQRIWADLVPFRRVGSASELAGAAVYLASPAASYTSGTLLVCNGARLW
jgi:NAD(P)-dependent dehydrogenase (short-subunit alcohol dehydrogenase family)